VEQLLSHIFVSAADACAISAIKSSFFPHASSSCINKVSNQKVCSSVCEILDVGEDLFRILARDCCLDALLTFPCQDSSEVVALRTIETCIIADELVAFQAVFAPAFLDNGHVILDVVFEVEGGVFVVGVKDC
jgi:hypothetical protein